jgi:hypothetical protein
MIIIFLHELTLAPDSETNSAVSSGALHAPAALSWDINFGSSHMPADDSSSRDRQPSQRQSSAPADSIADSSDQRLFRQPRSPPFDFGSSEFVRKSGVNAIDAPIGHPWGRDISKPLASHVPVQTSVFAPASFQRSLSPGRQDTATSDATAPSSEASTASVILLLVRQQQEQLLHQARRDERRDEQQARRDEQHRADMMQLMSVALTAHASPPPSPMRPIAVISTKSDAKLAEIGNIADIRGMFDTPERYDFVFDVHHEHETPVTNTVHAMSQFRASIQAQCPTNAPEFTDAQMKAAMFFQFNTGTSGVSITHFRPRGMTKISTASDLTNVLARASAIYGHFFGAYICRGFKNLVFDLLALAEEFSHSTTVATSIQLVDHFLAALRAALPYTPEAEDLNLGDIAADAMSIPLDHAMVLRFERHALHKAANASGHANSSDSPVADRNKRQPKSATTLNTGAAGGASSAREVAGGAGSPRSARPTIPGKSPCYSWASRTGPCGSLSADDECRQVNGPYPHKFDPATTPKEKAAFLGWLKNKE